jgi:hypothetical protein
MALRSMVYGLLVIDGTEATFGSTVGDQQYVQKAGHVANLAMSRTRRGGSSAPRYARKRDGAELGFLRRVVEKVQELLPHAGAFIVGGKAEMKRKLMKEMPLSLRSKVQLVVPYGGASDEAGLRYLASHCRTVRQQACMNDCVMCVNEFKSRYERTGDDLCCWGSSQTLSALRMGAVHCLLLADCDCGCDSVATEGEMLRLARASGASVVSITPDTEAGALFCKGFGIAGLLRWRMDVDDLEPSLAPPSEDDMLCEQDGAESEASTADTATDSWAQGASACLAGRLSQSLGDASSAEALAVGVEVLLACDIESIEDRIISAVELLREQGVQELVLQEFVAKLSVQYD